MDKWKQTLPNYSIFFHDDEAVAKLIDQEWPGFPDLRRAMRCVLYKGAMRIDVWRVLVLYKYGGVYTDIDNWPLDAFKESTIRNDLSAFFFRDGREISWI
jgi:mannosyltransferase OCH1-like enzyme